MPCLPNLRVAFKDISIYETKAKFFLVGYNEASETFQILEVNRPVMAAEEQVFLRQDPQVYTRDTLAERMSLLRQHFPGIELIASGVSCLWGFVKLLESHYLIYVTKKRKVASILGHEVYTVEKTQMLTITYKVRSSTEETKYKAILSAMDLTKHFYFSYSYDLTKSYQRNMTDPRGNDHVICQDMFIWNSYAVKALASAVTASTQNVVRVALTGWFVPVIHGFLDQRSYRFACGSVVHFTLIARRSRFFAGTRYLRRGVNGEGHVANEVESEQLFTMSDPGNAMYGPRAGRGSSIVQCRGSVPLFWSHVNLYSPKPDFRLENGDIDYAASKAHFQSLFGRYGRRVQCFNLVRQSPHKEELLGTAFRDLCPTLNRLIGPTSCYGACTKGNRTACEKCSVFSDSGGEAISYMEYDFLKNAHAKPGEVSHLFSDLATKGEYFFDKFGFYVDPPLGSNKYLSFPCLNTGSDEAGRFCGRSNMSAATPPADSCHRVLSEEVRCLVDSILNDGVEEDDDEKTESGLDTADRGSANFIESTFGAGAATGLLQYGTLRVNCVDCLDRTNVAAFCYARVAIAPQLKALGCLPGPKALRDIVTSCMKVWAEHGDAIATQYGGSGAMHKVDAEGASNAPAGSSGIGIGDADQPQDTVFVLTGGAKNALVAAKRYYSNVLSDYERQNSIDMLLGVFKPQYKDKHIWELKLRPENIRHGKYGRRSSDLSALRAAGTLDESAGSNSPLALLKQMSKTHFTDDDSDSSEDDSAVKDEPADNEHKESEILSHIEYHKNTKDATNVIILATISGNVHTHTPEMPSYEMTSFDSTLQRDYETLALDMLPFTPFSVVESVWQPSIFTSRLLHIDEAVWKESDIKGKEHKFNFLEEQIYDYYLKFYYGGLIDDPSINFPMLLRTLESGGLDSMPPLAGSAISGSKLRSVLSLTAKEQALVASSGADAKLLHAYLAVCPPQEEVERDVLQHRPSDARMPSTDDVAEQTEVNEILNKWEEVQKLREIFDPFSLTSFPGVDDKEAMLGDDRNSMVTLNSELNTTDRKSEVLLPCSATNSVEINPNATGSSGDSKKSVAAPPAPPKKPKWSFWGSGKRNASDVEVTPFSTAAKPTPAAAAHEPEVTQVLDIPRAITGPRANEEILVDGKKDLKQPQKAVLASIPSVNSESAMMIRVNAAVDAALTTRLREYEAENLKLKVALQCMQRKMDDICNFGFSSNDRYSKTP